MRNISIIVLFTICFASSKLWSQSLALYNLRNDIAQNARFNAAFIPEGKTVIGLPVISGISVGLNGATNYNNLISSNSEGQLIVDFDKMVDDLDEKSFYHVNATLGDLYLGFKMQNAFVSFFINERVEINAFTPQSLLEFAWQGNNEFGGRFYDFEKFGVDFKYYREIGVGYAKPINNQLRVGGRLKLIQGIIAGRTDRGFNTRIRNRANTFLIDFEANNARYDMSGKNTIENGSHLINNPSKGVALDLGLAYQLSDLAYLSFGLNDVGFIGWKADPENFVLRNTDFEWRGIELQTIEDLGEQVKDSLKSKFAIDETKESFTTGLNTRSYISMFFHPTYQDVVSVTLANRFVNGRLLATFGTGISHHFGKIFTAGATGSLTTQQGFDLGTAMLANLGPVQLYMAYDHLLGLTNVTKVDAFQFDFGLNLVFGREKVGKSSKDPRQEIIERNNAASPDFPASKGGYTPVIREEGIYQIIKKKKEPELTKSQPTNEDFNKGADYQKRMKPMKQKRRKNDFNKRSDERGIEQYLFWNRWFNKN